MDKTLEKRAMEALERQTKQFKRQNEFIKNNYDRVSVTLPKGTKDRIKQTGETTNNYIKNAVLSALDKDGIQ